MTEPTDVVEREPIVPQPLEGQEPRPTKLSESPRFVATGWT